MRKSGLFLSAHKKADLGDQVGKLPMFRRKPGGGGAAEGISWSRRASPSIRGITYAEPHPVDYGKRTTISEKSSLILPFWARETIFR